MLIPKLFAIVAADELFARRIVSHLCLGAFEFRDVVEEVEGEEDHCG